MTLDDLKRLFTRQTLFRLGAIHSPRLVPILYALGLAGVLVWAVRHLFTSFGAGFGSGVWSLVEIVVFGLLAFIALRIVCEALLVYFKSQETAGESVNRSRYSASLLEEVRDAIRDLAEEDEEDFAEADEYITPATEPPPRFPDVPAVPTPPPAARPAPPAASAAPSDSSAPGAEAAPPPPSEPMSEPMSEPLSGPSPEPVPDRPGILSPEELPVPPPVPASDGSAGPKPRPAPRRTAKRNPTQRG